MEKTSQPQIFAVTLTAIGSVGSGLMFLKYPADPLSLVPFLLCILPCLLPVIRVATGSLLFVGLLTFALVVDDISQVAWGREYEAITEILGMLLYESFGLMGIEIITLLFLALGLFKVFTRQIPISRGGLLVMGVISLSFAIASVVSLVVGMASGGSLVTHFIQMRFIHLLPICTFVGYCFITKRFSNFLLTAIVVVMTLKSIQGMAIYYLNPGVFAESEYLVDHYFSMFCVLGVSIALSFVLIKSIPLWIKLVLMVSQIPVLWAFVLNDRRTAYVGVGFSLLIFLAALNRSWYQRNGRNLFLCLLFLSPILAIGFVGPGNFGFLREPVLSIFTESAQELPSYRDLENANLMNAIVSNPLSGLGTGKEFDEVFPMPDISFLYDRYRMIPHNLVLAAWAYGGPLAIAAMGLIFSAMVAVAVKLIRHRFYLLGIGSLAFFVQYITFSYADLAFQIPRNQLFAGALFGACYRILVERKLE